MCWRPKELPNTRGWGLGAMKFNPFKPNGIISPGIFMGRIQEIREIEHGLFQAKHGNPVHFMIQGERGIGKSSLFFVTKLVANGEIETLTDEKLNFLVISVDLGSASTQLDIIRTIGRELKEMIGAQSAIKERAKVFWEWATNWEILGVRFHKDAATMDPHEALDTFVAQLANLCGAIGNEIDGILILIDEADRPGPEANLGEFCKLLTERLARKQCNNVVVGLAGLPTLLGQLKQSHESSPRLFTTMLLSLFCRMSVSVSLSEACTRQMKRIRHLRRSPLRPETFLPTYQRGTHTSFNNSRSLLFRRTRMMQSRSKMWFAGPIRRMGRYLSWGINISTKCTTSE